MQFYYNKYGTFVLIASFFGTLIFSIGCGEKAIDADAASLYEE
jgi:hypothetical protein